MHEGTPTVPLAFNVLINLGSSNYEIKPNDRIAQMVLSPIIKAEFKEVEELPNTDRGEGGFGSTGR